MAKTKRPWWRHWHVWGHDPGYTRKEARMVSEVDRKSLNEDHCIVPDRCDIDHSGKYVAGAG